LVTEAAMRHRKAESASILLHLDWCLADAIDMALQARVAHWNVRGPSSIGLHELFGKVYDMANSQADLLAERLAQLGQQVDIAVESVASRSRLPRYPTRAVMGRDHVIAMTEALVYYVGGLKQAAGVADSIDDVATLDILSEAIRDADKQRWLVESHLRGDVKFNMPRRRRYVR
jgi:starvation-inducible DNA-binding protein